jgi:hypothetical protein
MKTNRHFAVLFLFGFFCLQTIEAQESAPRSYSSNKSVANRQTLRTSGEDKLLHSLEADFVRLLHTARDPDRLLEAEKLLEETNDNSTWTNYSEATSVIRQAPEKAAIPLLLRYMVVHTKRSAHHVMIPEYEKTLALITGNAFKPEPDSRDFTEAAVRLRVQAFVEAYWAKESRKESQRDTADDLRITANALLEEVRKKVDFSGSGGGRDTVYQAYHNVYYRIQRSGSPEDGFVIRKMPQGMVPYLLEAYGFQRDKQPGPKNDSAEVVISIDRFPYEAIPILAELASNGERDAIETIADDNKQNATVRMVCIYSLFRSGGVLRSQSLIDVLRSETRLERRLIILLSLRWAGDVASETLMNHIDDENVEIATAAACALSEIQPDAALPKIQRLLERDRSSTSSLVYSTLGNWKTCAAKRFLAEAVATALKDKRDEKKLDQVLSAFVSAADLPRADWRSAEYRLSAAAEVALNQYQSNLAKAKAERDRLRAQVESKRMQWTVAKEIALMRKTEYKRLLGLQADDIVTAEESKAVNDRLVEIQAEVEMLQKKLLELEASAAAIEICE